LTAGLSGSLAMVFATPATAEGEEVGTALNRMIAWIQGTLVPLAILAFIVGIVLFIIGSATGNPERGRTLMIAAVFGLILAYLATPIINLATSFVR